MILQFMKWTKARQGGVLKELPGLVRRRKAECDLYFS
jgi:GH24 family phage-related lysozyme (muramidase)